jgi:hypothetical protein
MHEAESMNTTTAPTGGASMSPWIEAAFIKYLPILLGVGAGTAARYRLSMSRGRPVTWREVLSDLLIMPFIILVAGYASGKVGADPETAGMIGAFLGLSAIQITWMLRERFIERFDAELERRAEHHLGLARQVVQTERSAHDILNDTAEGRAPEEYVALKPHNPERPL